LPTQAFFAKAHLEARAPARRACIFYKKKIRRQLENIFVFIAAPQCGHRIVKGDSILRTS
jgi:hypothetical protein